jgi:hypothetical protein
MSSLCLQGYALAGSVQLLLMSYFVFLPVGNVLMMYFVRTPDTRTKFEYRKYHFLLASLFMLSSFIPILNFVAMICMVIQAIFWGQRSFGNPHPVTWAHDKDLEGSIPDSQNRYPIPMAWSCFSALLISLLALGNPCCCFGLGVLFFGVQRKQCSAQNNIEPSATAAFILGIVLTIMSVLAYFMFAVPIIGPVITVALWITIFTTASIFLFVFFFGSCYHTVVPPLYLPLPSVANPMASSAVTQKI